MCCPYPGEDVEADGDERGDDDGEAHAHDAGLGRHCPHACGRVQGLRFRKWGSGFRVWDLTDANKDGVGSWHATGHVVGVGGQGRACASSP